ncbi:hypothetical protein JCM11641_006589 [Rhodosporidiobolus odoratus]
MRNVPSVDHTRLARTLIKRVAGSGEEAEKLLVERWAQTPEQAIAAAEMASWSNTMSEDLNIAVAAGVALFLLFVAPLAASYVANNRLSSGWFLCSGSGALDTAVEKVDLKKSTSVSNSPSVKGKTSEKPAAQVVEISDRPLPLRIVPVSAFFAIFRTLYNRTLLPTSFLFNLTWGQVLLCLIYESIVMFCLFFHATDPRLNWKRSGAIAVAQMPALFTFATKNSLLSILGKGYEKINYLHRVSGRLVILCGLLHTLFFLLHSDLRWDSTTHVSGLALTIACVLILFTSISYFRKAFYQVFLISHILGWLTFLIALNFHVPDFARPYTLFCISIYGFDVLLRLAKTRIGCASIVELPGGMTMLHSHRINSGWRPGQHVWLRCWAGWRGWETHPFSVANAPKGSSPLPGAHNLTLLVKSTGDWTRALNKHAIASSTDRTPGRTVKVAIEGPYGGPMFTDFADGQAVILFAGGSGMTFGASILEELVDLACRGQLRTRSVTLIWAVKEVESLSWYQAFLTSLLEAAREKTCLAVRIIFHVTNPASTDLFCPIPHTSLRRGRPSPSVVINSVVDEVLASVQRKGLPRGGRIVVGTCGPKPLVEEVTKAVSGVEKGKAISVGGIVSYSETFGW